MALGSVSCRPLQAHESYRVVSDPRLCYDPAWALGRPSDCVGPPTPVHRISLLLQDLLAVRIKRTGSCCTKPVPPFTFHVNRLQPCHLSPRISAVIVPMIVSYNAAGKGMPNIPGDNRLSALKACVVRAITKVSNPNHTPPKAATIVLCKIHELSCSWISQVSLP